MAAVVVTLIVFVPSTILAPTLALQVAPFALVAILLTVVLLCVFVARLVLRGKPEEP